MAFGAALAPILGSATAGATIGGVSLGTIATVAGTAFSALSSIQAGNAQAAASKSQAAQARLQAAGERTQAEIEREQRTRNLRRTLARQEAIFAAQGGSGSSSSFGAIQEDTFFQGQRDIQIGANQSSINQEILSAQAAQFSSAARSARIGGFLGAGSTILGQFQRTQNRGEVPE